MERMIKLLLRHGKLDKIFSGCDVCAQVLPGCNIKLIKSASQILSIYLCASGKLIFTAVLSKMAV